MDNSNSFRREVFSSIYLMMLGIIQAAAFTFLLTETLAHVQSTYVNAETQVTFSQMMTDLRLHRSIGTLVAIALITFEYSYLVTVMYRAITVRDIVILFSIGIIEFGMASQTAFATHWWTMNIVFAIGGVFALLNTATFDFSGVFGGDKEKVAIARWHLAREIVLVTLAGGFAYFVLSLIREGRLGMYDELVLTIAWSLGFGAIMLAHSSYYVRRITS